MFVRCSEVLLYAAFGFLLFLLYQAFACHHQPF